jgi:hypothetical protein
MTDPLKPGDFTISVDQGSPVRIGDDPDPKNRVVFKLQYNGSAAVYIRVTLTVSCGQAADGSTLLAATTDRPTVTSKRLGKLTWSNDADRVSWKSGTGGEKVSVGDFLTIETSDFVCNTPAGTALVDVLVQTKNALSDAWSPTSHTTLKIEKELVKAKTAEPMVHYFMIDPQFVLHGGDTPVKLSFLATNCDTVTLYRNNQPVQHVLTLGGGIPPQTLTAWDEKELGDAKTGPKVVSFVDRPSISTSYRIVAKGKGEFPPIERTRTAQVAAVGWNRLALPQGYLTRLFVAELPGMDANNVERAGADNNKREAAHRERLYGIFVDTKGNASLYSSSTGIDDWRLEEGHVPSGMETSPGVTFDNKLWLVGGSAMDGNRPGAEVHCYEQNPTTGRYAWTQKAGFPSKMQPRAGHACVVVPVRVGKTTVKELWVIGGKNKRIFDDTWKLKQDGSDWESFGQKRYPGRWRHAAAVWSRKNRAGELDAEVWIFGGSGRVDEAASEIEWTDIWASNDKGEWSKRCGPEPGPGRPFAAALISTSATGERGDERLYLAGTFLQNAPNSNVSVSRLYEWQPDNKKWEAEEVGRGWDRFEGSEFYMHAVSFNRFLFLWSMHRTPEYQRAPRLNVLISS